MSNILYVLNLICHSAALNFIDLNQTHKVFASLYLFTKLLLNYCLWKLKWLKHILFLPNRWVAIPWHHRANCLSKSTCFGIPDASSRPMFRRTVSSKVLNNASKTKLNHLIWRRLQIMDVYFPDSFKLIEKCFTLRAKSRKIRRFSSLIKTMHWISRDDLKQFVHQIKCHIRPISDLSDDHCHEFKITSLHPFSRLVWSIQMLRVSAVRQC